eukprot:228136-Pyramimonas_sp.AAC.1
MLSEVLSRKKEEEVSKRYAKILEDYTGWEFQTGKLAVELRGDSQCAVQWIQGLYFTANVNYDRIVGGIQNTIDTLAKSCGVQAASLGRRIFKWVYREDNTSADELTHRARHGGCETRFRHDFPSLVKAIAILIDAIRGSFDGGRSYLGVGCGWQIDIH